MNGALACDWVFAHAERTPTASAVDTPDHRLSYGELARRIRILAGQFHHSGVRPGTPLVMALPNTPVTAIASLAGQHVGATVVEVNREWGVDVLEAILDETGARHVVLQGRDARTWRKLAFGRQFDHLWVVHPNAPSQAMLDALPECPSTWLRDEGPTEGEPLDQRPSGVDPDNVIALVYTSGSTGTPRAVIQAARNQAANARSIVQYLELGPSDRAMLILPLYYCYGKSVLNTHLLVGGSVFMDHRFMYPKLVLDAIGTESCTGFAGVPLTFELLRRNTRPEPRSMPNLRYLTQAGGPMHPDTIDWVRSTFRPAHLFVMYGQTEATARLSYLPPDRAQEKRGSIGVAIPGVELRVVDDAGVRLGPRVNGNLVARGGNVCAGYFRSPDATAEILREGWLWTGDLAYEDEDGYFFLVGRTKEIIKVGGHRVSPVEIEHLLCAHPDVVDAGVTSTPDTVLGEALVAMVVLRDGATVTAADLRKHCAEKLPLFKIPKDITFVPSLPRSAAGKLLRSELALAWRRRS